MFLESGLFAVTNLPSHPCTQEFPNLKKKEKEKWNMILEGIVRGSTLCFSFITYNKIPLWSLGKLNHIDLGYFSLPLGTVHLLRRRETNFPCIIFTLSPRYFFKPKFLPFGLKLKKRLDTETHCRLDTETQMKTCKGPFKLLHWLLNELWAITTENFSQGLVEKLALRTSWNNECPLKCA